MENSLDQCIKCAECTVYCPVLKATDSYPGPKKAGPDGERLRLKDRVFFEDNLKMCLNCKRCEVVCPSGVKIADIIQRARHRHGRPIPGIRDMMLASTDLTGSLAVPFSGIINPVLKNGAVRAVLDCTLGIDRHCTLPEYAQETFESIFKKRFSRQQQSYPRKVNYFHGCYVNYNYPQLGTDFVKLMNALGFGVSLIRDERCCGVPLMSNGMFKQATRNAESNVNVLSGTEGPVIATSSTCLFTMRDEYPAVLGVDNSSIRERLTLAVKFIYESVSSGKVRLAFREGWKARAAYHVPCHMERLGWGIFTLELLGMIPGLELMELDSNCCGMAGTYGFKKENYGLSQQIGSALFSQISGHNPDFVICECETCKWQIEMSTGYKVLNPVSLLAEALDLKKTAKLNQPALP